MRPRQPLPPIWIVSDARNDAVLERAIARVPRGSGLIFRHYHLPPDQRRARFDRLRRLAKARGHVVVLAGTMAEARRWQADGAYGDARKLARGPAGLRLITAHSLKEISAAGRASAIFLSPVFPTRSHSASETLGRITFLVIARWSGVPVVALGGMNKRRAQHLGGCAWAAIDSFL